VQFDTADEKRAAMITLLQDIFRTGLLRLNQLK